MGSLAQHYLNVIGKTMVDDKLWVICSVTIIACWGAWVLRNNPSNVILVLSNALSGLFGIAVGKGLNNDLHSKL